MLDIQETYLTSLSGLENLISVGIVAVFGNSQLIDISALQNIDPTTIIGTDYEGLAINDNPILSVCNIPNLCTYLQGSGWRYIANNAGDCISEQAILATCALSVDDYALNRIKTYPNPVKEVLHFSKEIHKITLIDLTGKVFKTQNNSNQIDMPSFQTGVYFVTIEQENDWRETKKVVKK